MNVLLTSKELMQIKKNVITGLHTSDLTIKEIKSKILVTICCSLLDAY